MSCPKRFLNETGDQAADYGLVGSIPCHQAPNRLCITPVNLANKDIKQLDVSEMFIMPTEQGW